MTDKEYENSISNTINNILKRFLILYMFINVSNSFETH